MTLLEVRDLEVRFDTEDGLVRAVDGVSFSVDEGRCLGIVGESGSGKTVAALAVMGLGRFQGARVSGRALLEGRDLISLGDAEMREVRGRDVAMIFQDPLSSLHPFHRVGDQLVEAVRAHRKVGAARALERATELLALVGIPEPERRARFYPHEFSGGMRQRVMIAMALVNEPKVLIADEPTSALDVTVQAQILELLERLRRQLGMAVIVISHDLGVVAETADEVAVMYAGRIVEHAPAATIFSSPEHPYTWGLLRSIPRVDAPRGEPLLPIPGPPASPISRPSGCSFHPRCPYVRDAHRRVDPPLEPVPEDPGHHVACLLEPAGRRRLWRELRAGADPAAARETVGV